MYNLNNIYFENKLKIDFVEYNIAVVYIVINFTNDAYIIKWHSIFVKYSVFFV